MFQTDQATAATSLPAPAAPGTQGYFTNGNPGTGVAATILDADFMNMTMLELCNIVTAAGMVLSKTTYNQVLSAIRRIVQNTVVLADTGAANAYTAVNAVPLVAGSSPTWIDGVVQAVKIAHTNTGASTYAPDGLAAIPIYGLGLNPLQGTELFAGGTAILMHATIASVNSGNPICVLMECAGGAQQIAAPTQSQHAAQFANIGNFQSVNSVNSNVTLTSSSFGQVYEAATGDPGGRTITFPSAAGNAGKAIILVNSSSGNWALNAGNINCAYGSGSSVVMPPNSTGIFVSDNTSYNAVGGSAAFGSGIRPQTSSGIGQWQGILASAVSGTGYLYLPSGGTWAYWCSNAGNSYAGIAAGGTNITGTVTLGNAFGFCWRIA